MTMLAVGKNDGACGGREWRCWQREGMLLLVAGKTCNAGSGDGAAQQLLAGGGGLLDQPYKALHLEGKRLVRVG